MNTHTHKTNSNRYIDTLNALHDSWSPSADRSAMVVLDEWVSAAARAYLGEESYAQILATASAMVVLDEWVSAAAHWA